MQFYEKRVLVTNHSLSNIDEEIERRGEGGTEMAGSRKGVK